MADENYKRKLTAILSADVAGYSRLMSDDETATVSTLKSHRNLFSEKVQEFNGRVVDSPGDNILAEFRSIVDAVSCAVEIQHMLKEKNEDFSDNRKMVFRIGVNLGDVIQDEDRIYGDGVNIASRIEGLADPGGVAISGTAFDNIRNKLDCGYQFSGEHAVKNIANPVRVYKILTNPECAGKVIGEKRFLGWMSRKVAISIIMALAIVTGGLTTYYIYLYRSGRIEPASVAKMAFPLPDKPSIVVLPFVNLSEDSKQDYFIDGLTLDIIASLSKIRDLFVIARDSALVYKGKPTSVKQIAEDLGVRYVLEGSYRRVGERVRVTAQLIDALSGRQLWTDRYDRSMDDFFALQDEINMKVVTALQVKLTEGEKIGVLLRKTDNLAAYEKYLVGREHFLRFNPDDNIIARPFLKEAIALDPNFASPYVDLAWTYVMEIHYGVSASPKESLEQAEQLAQKAISLDETYPFAYGLLGDVLRIKGRYEEAIALLEKAVGLSPNYSLSQAQLGRTMMYAGRFEEALAWLEKAIRLDPIPLNWYVTVVGICYLHLGRLEDSVKEFKKVLNRNPDDLTAAIRLVAAYSLLERKDEANAAAAEVLRLNPKFSIAKIAKSWSYKNDSDKDLELNALRKAGLPE
ncbi:MAG: adenylate/guanylate cyclase domain-containing protein [Anaerolineales bacterium]